MPKSIISEGKTTNEAIEKGLKELGVSKNKVEINVLKSEEKRSFFSILAPRVVKVELTLKEEKNTEKEPKLDVHISKEKPELSEEELDLAKKNVELFLNEFLPKIGDEITYTIKKEKYGLSIVLNGDKATVLIGYRGETLYDLQNILSIISNKKIDKKVKVILDIENYKGKREKTLEDLALKIAKTVEKTGKSVTLEPMKAYERKIIHSKLQLSSTVTTKSIGEEPRRRVVISLK